MFPRTIVLATSLVMVACSDVTEPTESVSSAKAPQAAAPLVKPTVVERSVNMAQIARGGTLYQQNCATCHGTNGEGAPNWRERDADGKFPPPPLNGSGHTWHHPLSALRYTIRHGTQAIGGSMPAWKDKLSDADIDAVIAWFQSQWPDEAYAAWYDIDQRARKRKQ